MNTHLVVTEDAVSGFPCSEVGMGRVRTSKRTRDDAETSCDSSYYGISNENSVLSQEGAENGDSSPPPRVHIARVVKKKTKVQPQLITGVRIMDDGSTSPLTAAPQQREPSADKVNVLTIKSKKRGASQDPPSDVFSSPPPARPANRGVSMSKGLEFTDELLQKLGQLQI